MPAPIFLASRSPRRQELLQQIGMEFELLDCEVDETPVLDEDAETYVMRICREKLHKACQLRPDTRPVLVADTCVVIDQQILGKPRDLDQARSMIQLLSGRDHRVFSGVGLGDEHRQGFATSITTVTVANLGTEQIDDYLASEESLGKAGAYAIQGRFAIHISRMQGSYSGVMGLPLYETAKLLNEFDIL